MGCFSVKFSTLVLNGKSDILNRNFQETKIQTLDFIILENLKNHCQKVNNCDQSKSSSLSSTKSSCRAVEISLPLSIPILFSFGISSVNGIVICDVEAELTKESNVCNILVSSFMATLPSGTFKDVSSR